MGEGDGEVTAGEGAAGDCVVAVAVNVGIIDARNRNVDVVDIDGKFLVCSVFPSVFLEGGAHSCPGKWFPVLAEG